MFYPPTKIYFLVDTKDSLVCNLYTVVRENTPIKNQKFEKGIE